MINSIVEPRIADAADGSISGALWLGFIICVFSWCCGLGLVLVDSYADKKDGKKAELSEDDKFKCKQLLEFTLPFWLLVISCVSVYCSIFPYTSNTQIMLIKEFNIEKNLAGTLISLPFFISAGISPFLGCLIDKVGKRALFIMSSSFFVFCACGMTAILVQIDTSDGKSNWSCLAPLILLGLAYSVYAGALWSSIPYVVKPHTLGTAFGICTAVQNIGLTILPLGVASTIKKDNEDNKYYGYVHEQILLAAFALTGFCFNIWLYCDDKHKRNGQLDKVPSAEEGEGIDDMMTSPTQTRP